jgi:uncharacterized protein YlxP (DUF503 family)
MTTTRTVANLELLEVQALVDAHNEMNAALAAQGLMPHHAPCAAVADTGTADLAAVQVLANALKAAYNLHVADTGAHVAADATNVTTAAAASDQSTSNTLLNELKADFNAHIALAAAHRTVLGAGVATLLTVATTDASDLATSKALAAALLLAFNRHFAAGSSLIVLKDA